MRPTAPRGEIEEMLDRHAWDAALAEEQHNRGLLDAISRNWTKVKVEDFMRDAT